MKSLTLLIALTLLFLTGCSTLDLTLTDRVTGQPISGATILVQSVSLNEDANALTVIGTTTTNDQGNATLNALFNKHKDFQLFITRQNDRYRTTLVGNSITNQTQTVTGIQSLRADQQVPDPSTPSINLKYHWQ